MFEYHKQIHGNIEENMAAKQNIEHQGSTSAATASLVLGILSIPVVGFGLVLGILAIIFGVISLQKNQARKMAIAGIITGSIGVLLPLLFLITIFLAIPTLSRNNRDTTRKSDIMNITSDIVDYQSENQGKMPSKYDLSKTNLVIVTDIQQAAYDGYGYDGDPQPTQETAVYVIGENCDGQKADRNFSVTIRLENNTVSCVGS